MKGFWAGWASALDFFGVLYDPSELRRAKRRRGMTPAQADRDAFAEDAAKIAGDWQKVGESLRNGYRCPRSRVR